MKGGPDSRVVPHGLIGQSYLNYQFANTVVGGKLDEYVPDGNGEFTTSAQGEGAIQGTIDDYEIQGGDYSSKFRFSRFGMEEDLSSQQFPRSADMKGIAHAVGDVLEGDVEQPSK